MRTFTLQDLLQTIKNKRAALNEIAGYYPKVYLDEKPSLLVHGVVENINASVVRFSLEPKENVEYVEYPRYSGIMVIKPQPLES